MLNVKTFSLFLGVTFLTFSPPVQAAIEDVDSAPVNKLLPVKNTVDHPDGLQEESKKATDTKPGSDELVASASALSVSDSPKSAPLSRPPEFSGGTCFPPNRYNRPPEVDGAGAKVTTTRWRRPEGSKSKMKRSVTDHGFSGSTPVPGDPRIHPDRNY